jgi:hypothetical protein
MQAAVQVWVVRLHVGVPPEHCASLVQSTHSPVPVSQTCICGAQSAGFVHPVQTPFVVSQKGVVPPHCASLVHAGGAPLLLPCAMLEEPPPELVAMLPLLALVALPPVALDELAAPFVTVPPQAAAATVPSAKRTITRFTRASHVRVEASMTGVVPHSRRASPPKVGAHARPFRASFARGGAHLHDKDFLKVGGGSRKGRGGEVSRVDFEAMAGSARALRGSWAGARPARGLRASGSPAASGL